MKLTILESPFEGDTARNIEYAQKCMHDMLVNHNEAPYASHLLYTQPNVLDDNIKHERDLGIRAGFAWKHMDCVNTVFYTDLGMSHGMELALDYCREYNLPYEFRRLNNV